MNLDDHQEQGFLLHLNIYQYLLLSLDYADASGLVLYVLLSLVCQHHVELFLQSLCFQKFYAHVL